MQDREKRLSKITLALFILTVLTLTIILTPAAKADGPSIVLDPSQGPAGKMVTAYIKGYPETSDVNITFGTTKIGSGTANPAGNVCAIVEIPQVPAGDYIVTATGTTGNATTTFIVTEGPSPTPTETTSGTPTGLSPTKTPATASAGFWSPLIIGITSAVVAIGVFMTFLFIRRGRQKTLQPEEVPRYEPHPSVPSRKPYTPSKINQPATSTQPPPYTKICKHCKRTVRDDLNVCPYCYKRLR